MILRGSKFFMLMKDVVTGRVKTVRQRNNYFVFCGIAIVIFFGIVEPYYHAQLPLMSYRS